MAGDEDHRKVRVVGPHPLEQGAPVHAGQAHVGDDNARRLGPDGRERGFRGFEGLDREAVQFEALAVGPAHVLLVVDEDDALGSIGLGFAAHEVS